MPDATLNDIDVAKHGRWLRKLAGTAPWLGICEREGPVLWSDGATEDELTAVIAAARETGFAWDAEHDGMQRYEVPDEGATLLYRPIPAACGGWLVAVMHATPADPALDIDPDAPASAGDAASASGAVPAPHAGHEPAAESQHGALALDAIAEAFDDIAASLRDELRTTGELDTMAQELAARYEELHLVYEVDKQIRSQAETRKLFCNLLDNCAKHLNADVCALVSQHEEFRLSATNLSKPIHNLDLVLVELRGDMFRFVSSAKQVVVLNDRDDPRRAYIFTHMPYKVMAYPIFTDDAVTSMLVLINHEHKDDFSNSDRKLGEMLASQLSGLIRLYSMMNEMARFTEQMAAALIEAVEAKDPYTRGHSERVHHISMEIGRALGLRDDDLENLYWGSLLHDVGKIGIPDAVLCKPGRLSRDEYTFIMVHPERSYEILRHIDRLKDAVPGARHHQEKWDGTGYPHGLKGDRIPLHGRIIAVADTYDSITSSRAYRPGRSHEVAIAEIDRVAGTQLDPAIVAVFKAVCEKEPEWLSRFHIRRDQPEHA